MEGKIENKYPKLSKGLVYFKEVWAETFPDEQSKLGKRME